MKHCLIVSGGYPGHHAVEAAERVRGLLEEANFSVRTASELCAYDEEDLLSYDLIVPNWTVGQMGIETAKRLSEAVQHGVGLGGFHGGMADGFPATDLFRFMVGGQYVREPGGVRRYTVNITDRNDPIMVGIDDFAYESEQYYLHVDPANHVLATTTFDGIEFPWIEGVVMPTVWKKPFGRGRVFFSALGHVPEEFEHEAMRTILFRGLLWASR
jgi:type 1 glutamine amidotransferase